MSILEVISIPLGILGAIGGILWLRDQYRRLLSKNSFEQIFGSLRNRRTLIVCPGNEQSTVSPNVMSTYEDSMAQSIIQSQFAENGIYSEAKLHSQLHEEERSNNLVLICGPVGNSITRAALSHPLINLPYKFKHTDTGWIIVDTDGEQVHPPRTPKVTDFAIVARVANPWSQKGDRSWVFIVAGISGLGTWGAAYYLAKQTKAFRKRLLAENVKPTETGFAAIVRAKSAGSLPPTTTIIDLKTF